jgi:hypothetical protein
VPTSHSAAQPARQHEPSAQLHRELRLRREAGSGSGRAQVWRRLRRAVGERAARAARAAGGAPQRGVHSGEHAARLLQQHSSHLF